MEQKKVSFLNKWWNAMLLGVLFFLVGRFIIVGGLISDLLMISSAVLVIFGIVQLVKRKKK